MAIRESKGADQELNALLNSPIIPPGVTDKKYTDEIYFDKHQIPEKYSEVAENLSYLTVNDFSDILDGTELDRVDPSVPTEEEIEGYVGKLPGIGFK